MVLQSDFCTVHLAGLPEPLRKCFCTAFGLDPDAGVTVEAVTAVTLEEAQRMLKEARVGKPTGEGGRIEEREPTGLELGQMMTPV